MFNESTTDDVNMLRRVNCFTYFLVNDDFIDRYLNVLHIFSWYLLQIMNIEFNDIF